MPIPDNYYQWEAHDRRQSYLIQKLPRCERCGNAIQQERAVCIDGCWYCDDCIEFYREEVGIE